MPHLSDQAPAEPQAAQNGTQRRLATPRAVFALMLREMATRYGKSPGGYVWALMEPLGAIILLSVGFSLLVRTPPLGNSFLLFYATGFLPFVVYQDVSNLVARCINFSRALLHYPAVTWVDAALARFLLNALTGILVMIILLTGILAFTDTRVVININPVLLGTALALLLGGGVGMMNCVLLGLFPVWAQIWSIATRPLFLVSGIFILFDDMPPTLRELLWWNPLIHVVGLVRTGFFPTYTGDYISVTFVIAVGLICLTFGVLLMGRYHRDILHNG